MRAALVAALVLLSVACAPAPAGAQSAEPFVKDAEGDTEFRAMSDNMPAKVPFTAGDAATVDILAFDLVESDTALEFVLQLKSLKQTAGFTTYEMRFTWGKTPYVVGVRMSTLPGITPQKWAYLATDDDGWDWRAQLEPQVDVEKGILRVVLEKAYILDGREEVPVKGDVLKDVYAEASLALLVFSGFFGEITDRAPDGEGAKAFTFQVGNFHSGSLRAGAEHPVRVSNGGSTTFVYRVDLANAGSVPHEVDARLESLPEGWNVTIQSPIRLAPEETKTLAVLASVPFGHKHGGFDSFQVNFTSRADPGSRASVRLGVLHTPIPQPAGHHSELYLHVQKASGVRIGGWGEASMNTDSSHDQDEAEAFVDSFGDGVSWWIPLNPRLAMGLDFDLARAGTLVGAIVGRTTGEATLTAELLYGPRSATPWDDDGLMLLADSDAQKVALDLSTPKPFSLVLTPTEEADYLPFDPEANVFLVVRAESADLSFVCCIDQTSPSLTTADFKLTLPLNEYHDKLTGLAEAAAAVDLVADGPVEKLGRPGTVMTYAFTLKNGGAQPATFEVDLAGTDAAAGSLVPQGAIELGPRETRKLTLAVSIPPEAKAGQELEVLLFVHARDDPSKSAIARTKTTVALGGEAGADETDLLVAAQAEEDKDTPGPGAALGALALAGAALLAARRRR